MPCNRCTRAMNSQQKKTSGCASNLLAHEDLGHLRKPIVGIYKPSSIMKNSHYYEQDNLWDSLYEKLGATLKHNIWDSLHEEEGATLKHKCGKGDSSIAPFSLFFLFSLFWAFSYFLWPFSPLFLFPHLGQCSRKWWSSHFYLFTTQWLQLDARTKDDSIWMPPVVYRDMQ